MPKGVYIGKRTMVTLPEDVDDVFNRASVLWGKPKATVLRELLIEAAPQLRELVEAVDDIKNNAEGALNRAGAVFLNQLSSALAEMADTTLQASPRLDGTRARRAGGKARRRV